MPQMARKKKKSTALAKACDDRKFNLSRRYMPAPEGKDLTRWFMFEGQGMSVADIAAREGTTPAKVQSSLDYIKQYMFRNQLQVLNAKTVQVAMERLDDSNVALKGALKAKKVVHIDRATGKITQVEDHATRLKAVAENRAMIEMMQPRQPGAIINQQFNTAFSGTNGTGGGMSFESVLRRKRELKGIVNEQEVDTESAELSHEEQIAEEFEDFGGTDTGDDEDESFQA